MGIRRAKLPTTILEPSDDLGLSSLMRLGSKVKSEQEDLSFLEKRSALLTVTNDDVFDVEALVNESIASISLVPKDIKYDDSSMPTAPNFLDWCEGSEFLNAKPYLEQALAGIRLFAEWCPDCSDREWLEDIEKHDPRTGTAIIRDKITLMEHGICPKCGKSRLDHFKSGALNFYNELVLLWGQRSGKSEVTAMLNSYITHRVLKMQDPTRIYGIGNNQVLQITFVALTQSQAIQNLWTPFHGYLTGAPWFKKYHELMAFYDAKYGLEMVKIKDTYVLYKHRNLLLLPASPDQRTLRGRTRLASSLDEIGWFDNAATAAGKMTVSASGTYAALSNSLQTVRSEEQRLIAAGMVDCLSAYMFNISSPSSIRDKICELYRLSQGSKKMLGIHAPTWKINPKFSRATLDEDFRKDPIGAERDFGANPPLSSAPFIRDTTIIFGNIKQGKNYINYQHKVNIGNDVERTKTRYATMVGCKEGTAPSILAIDAGETNNSFAMAVMSMQGATMSIDCLIDIMPLPGIPLNYSLIYKEIIMPVCKARNVRVVLSDRWNSTKLLQDLFDMAIVGKYQKYSLKYEDMWNFKSRLEQRSVAFPKSVMLNAPEQLRSLDVSDYPRCFENRPVEHFMFQCVTVQDTGRMVIKGPDMTDDLWRAVVLGAWGLENPDFKYYMQETKKAERRDPRRLAVGKGGSSASGSSVEGGSKIGSLGVVRKKRGGFDK